jgi:RHS repeat-associated protein
VATDSLVRIEENGLVEVEFSYAPTSDPTVYSNTACAVGFDCLSRGMWVVKTHVVHDRPGGHAMYHKYDSGFFHRGGRRWLGMKSHTVNDGASGAVTVTRFDPTRRGGYGYPYAGLPVEVEQRLGNRTSTTKSTYTRRVSSRGSCTDCFEYPQLDEVDKRIVETADGVTSEVMRVVEAYKYDDFGNATWTKSSSDEETLTTDTAFRNDTTNWLIGLPTRVSTTSEATASRMRATRVVSLEYREDGTLEQVVTEPDATDGTLRSATEYIWQDGLLSSVTVTAPDQLPRTSTYTYRDGQLYTVQNALGHTSAAVYSGLGTIAATTDSSGVMTTMTYDGFGRPRSVTPADGSLQWVESARDGDGIATTARHAGGGSSVTRFDRFGRVIETTGSVAGGSSLSVSYLYDYRNLMYARTLPRAPSDPEEWATYVRDAVGRLTLETVPGQPPRSWSYSGRTSVETVGDRTVTTSRDGHGRTAHVRTATGRLPQRRIVRLFYGPFDTLVRRAYRYSKSQPLDSKSQSFVYDAWNRLSSASDPDRGLREFEYNGYGELVAEVLANGIRTEFQYDQLGRLTSSTSTGDASHTEYDWGTDDHPGLLDSVSVDGAVTSYGYDEIGRVASRSLSVRDVAISADFTYDAVGRLSTVTYPEGAQGRPSVRYEYDDVGELVKLHDERTLEPLWERTSVNHRGQHTGHRLGNGVTSTFQYNSSWRTIERAQSVSSSGEPVLDFEWKYSLLDSRVDIASRIDHARGKQQRYRQYDDQLQSWSAAAAGAPDDQHDATVSYEYDDDVVAVRRSVHGPDGESLEQHDFDIDRSRETQNNQIATSPWGTYTYDASGNQVQRPGQAVTYTARGLPRTVTDDRAGTFEFAYDAAGGRVMKERDDGSYTIYLDKLYERRRTASGEIQDVYYFMATGLVGQLSVKTPAGGEPTAAMHYFHGDEQGSVRVITDRSGAVAERLDYDPFGSRIDLLRPTDAGSASAITTRGYTGHEHDDDLGLINMGGRVYDPALMRFLSPDPLTAPMTENRAYDPYTYARLNPARYVDPSGFNPCSVTICISNDGVSTSWEESGHHFSYSRSATSGGMRYGGYEPPTSSMRPTTASTMGRAETAWAAVAGAFSTGADMLGSASSAVADGTMWTAKVGKAIMWETAGSVRDTAELIWEGNKIRMRGWSDPVGTFREEWDKKGHLIKALWDDPGGVTVAVAGSVAQQTEAVVRAAGDGDPEAVAKIVVFIGEFFVGGASTSSRGASRGVPRALLAPVKMQRHHIFPQQFRDFFYARGVDIDKHTVEISQGRHLGSVHGRGDAITPGRYNQRWAEFIEANPNATAKDIYQFGGRLMDEYGLSGLQIVPYR